MNDMSNRHIIEKLYQDYAAGNIAAVFSCFDKDIVWVRPGEPEIPFAGTFKGIEALTKMFAIQAATLNIKSFLPKKICVNDDTVAVLGVDTVVVTSTGKTYTEEWVQSFTFKNKKIVHVQVYMDTKAIANAFIP